MTRSNTNSVWAWLATVAVHAGATAWLGWRGLMVAATAFLVGSIGALVNVARAGASTEGSRDG